MKQITSTPHATVHLLLAALLLLAATPVVFAAQPMAAGDYAFAHGMHGQTFQLVTSSSATPGGFEYQYTRFSSENRAWRCGASASLAYSHTTQDQDNQGGGTQTRHIDQNRFDGSVQGSLQMVFYPMAGKRLQASMAFGPMIGYAWESADSETKSRSSSSISTYDRPMNTLSHTWVGGLLGTLGVEWYLAPHLSLTTQYGASLIANFSSERYSTSSDLLDPSLEDQSSREDRYEADWRFTTTSIAAGLTFYY